MKNIFPKKSIFFFISSEKSVENDNERVASVRLAVNVAVFSFGGAFSCLSENYHEQRRDIKTINKRLL